jgi:hypothetical protein
MKQFLLLFPVLGLAACAGQHPAATTTATAAYPNDGLPTDSREPSRVHTYLVNDYIDPNDPRILHRGHAVEVVEQDEKWNLDATDSPDDSGAGGPVTMAADTNATPNPYSAEFETELSRQRDQYRQLAGLGAQMTAEMGRLQDLAEKQADAVAENAVLRTRLQDLQREIDELKPQPPTPVNPNAPKNPSWWRPIFDLFRQLPDGAPVAAEKPKLRASLALEPVPPDAASTNAPDEISSPGEMAHPQHSPTNTP